jgi:hypothetical protein
LGNGYLKSNIIQVVNNQLNSNDPPETKETYNRLLGLGYTSDEAKDLIGIVVSSEIFEVLKRQEVFNKDRFVKALNKLPDTPS